MKIRNLYSVLVSILVLIFMVSCNTGLLNSQHKVDKAEGYRATTVGENLLSNNGFESGLDSWTVSGDSSAVYTEAYGYSGQRATFWSSGDFSTTISQTITGLDNGEYKLTVRSVGGSADNCTIFAENSGSGSFSSAVPSISWGSWDIVTLENITVTNNMCTVGISVTNSEWSSFDEVTFELVTPESAGSGVIDTNGDGDFSGVEIVSGYDFNYARIRVLVDPPGTYGLNQDLDYVVELAKEAEINGMNVLIDFFYSHWWCDPGQNWKPESWSSDISTLEGQIYDHTYEVLSTLQNSGVSVDMVQIGNEANDGMAWSVGRISENGWENFVRLTNAGKNAAKTFNPDIKILMQYAGTGNDAVNWFYNLNQYGGYFDVLGISFYEMWHGNIDVAVSTLQNLSSYGKDLVIIETAAYWKASEAGSSTSYAHTKEGQYNFLYDLTNAIENLPYVKGLFYWGAGWTQAENWLYAPAWGDDDAGCRGLFDDDARVNPAITAVSDAGGLPIMGIDISEMHYIESNGVNYLDLYE